MNYIRKIELPTNQTLLMGSPEMARNTCKNACVGWKIHLQKEKRKVDNMIKFTHEYEKAVKFTLDINGDVHEYAMAFLHIYNNARENSDSIYKVENCYDNRIFVTCNAEDEEQVEEYLSQFGKITLVEDVHKVNIYPVCDSIKDYDELYQNGDYDTQFFVIDG